MLPGLTSALTDDARHWSTDTSPEQGYRTDTAVLPLCGHPVTVNNDPARPRHACRTCESIALERIARIENGEIGEHGSVS